LIAPPVSQFNCQAYAPAHKPWTLIHGSDDDLIPSEAIKHFTAGLRHPPEVHFLAEASHFFHGKLNDLRHLLKSLFGSLQATTLPHSA
jgi:alpha/beta superfamily hydrolase